ncbi:MAG: PAS domain S-box protein [Bryobacteraceae bacterium]
MTGPQAAPGRLLSVLIAADSASDAELMLAELHRAGFRPEHRMVSVPQEMSAALDEQRWDLVLCKDPMPLFSYEAALALVREKGAPTPVLLVSDAAVDEQAVSAVRAGARDIIRKDHLSRLAIAVGRELDAAQDRMRRRGLEQELRKSEKRFRALIEHSFDAICLLNAEGNVVYASPSAERIVGFRAEELAGRNAFELIAPEDRPYVRQRLGELLLRPGETLTLQMRVMRKQGDYIWTEHVGTNLLREDSVGALVINFRDITQRKRYEQMLHENEELAQQELAELEHIYNTAPVGLCLLGTDLRYRRINERLAAMNGLAAGEHLGRTVADVAPESAPFLMPLLERIIESGRPLLNWQFRISKSGGMDRDFLASYYPVKASSGKTLGVAGVVQEITELKRIERALRDSEQRFRALIENSADGFVLLDADGKVRYSGPTILGYENQPFTGRDIFEIMHPDDRRALRSIFVELLTNPGKARMIEFRMRHSNGSWLSIEAMAKNLLSDPVIAGIVVNYRDVTERKRLEEQLRQAQKLESIGVLAGGVAHDFNNLLTGVLGNASLALDTLGADHPARQYIEDVRQATESAAHLTRQLLAYSGKGRFVLQPVGLSELAREISSLVRTSIPKNVQLRLDLAPDLPPVEGDPGQIQQLVMNLVINGAEAIGEKSPGSVLVKTSLQLADEEYVRTTFEAAEIPPGSYVSLEVQDDGEGMDSDTQSKIFDPFFTTKFSGRGLGLSAVLGIVRGHKGAIKVSSSPGEGTLFKVLLPAVSRPAAVPLHPELNEDLRGTGTILVVDDEEIVRRTARSALERQGYSVVLAETGAEAVEIFRWRRNEIRVVLLDLTMPGPDGEATFEQLRRLKRDVKVLLSSGYSELEAIERFDGKGLAGFIQKPYTSAQLAQKIKIALKPVH